MKKNLASAALACVMFGTSIAASTAPAFAQRDMQRYERGDDRRHGDRWNDRARFSDRYCHRNPRDCRDRNRGWRDARDHRHDRWRDRDDGDAAAAAVIGLAAGAIAGAAISGNSTSAHIRACEAQYRSYDRATDTYLGYDGRRHRCTAY